MFCEIASINNSLMRDILDKLGARLYSSDLCLDSRLMTNHAIFCAYRGNIYDGRDFIDIAVKNFVQPVILWDSAGGFSYQSDIIQNFSLENLQQYVGILAAAKYNYPSSKLDLIGVTGTNGKTSITNYLASIYNALGLSSGYVGTLGNSFERVALNTTPDAIHLHQLLHRFTENSTKMVAMEVSSHALSQGRVNGCQFKTAIFTNLTHDHLDYHKNMECYYLAKKSIFLWHNLHNAIINVDDEYGARLFDELRLEYPTLNIMTYSINSNRVIYGCYATNITHTINGISFDLHYVDRDKVDKFLCVTANLFGVFNVYNLLAVACDLLLNGVSLADIAIQFAKLQAVSGRMELVPSKSDIKVFVDYAHTPSALSNVLNTIRQIATHRVICVFGCGGDRDSSKRSIMGSIATQLADFVIITNDNPRHEDPELIIQQIITGIDKSNYLVCENRESAIRKSIDIATPGDCVVIAGKGHESYQDINGVRVDFSDQCIVRSI